MEQASGIHGKQRGKRMISRYKRVNPKRKTPRAVHSERTAHLNGGHKRVRLYGAERMKRRAEIFARAGRYCEEIIRCPLPECNEGGVPWHVYRCPNPPTEWSHAKHGSNKCDCTNPACNWASCTDCHRKRHNCGGKPITVRKKDIA